MSSGCATTASARVQSSGSGSSGGGVSMGPSMPPNAVGPTGRGPVGWSPWWRSSELDPDDDAGLREFFDVEQAAQRADHPHAVLRTFPQLLQMVRRPSSYFRRTLLVARDAGRIVGTAELGLTVEDNLHLAHAPGRASSRRPGAAGSAGRSTTKLVRRAPGRRPDDAASARSTSRSTGSRPPASGSRRRSATRSCRRRTTSCSTSRSPAHGWAPARGSRRATRS